MGHWTLYREGEQVESICLKSGRICIVEGNVFRPLVKERIYEDQTDHTKYPGYIALGAGAEVFIDTDPIGMHDIIRLLPK